MTHLDQTGAATAQQYLSYVVGPTEFGVPILKVKEILQYEGVTPVPGTPPSIRGVINVRGAVVPVVDLGVRLGGAPVADTRRTCVLVVEIRAGADAVTLGVLADAVNEVLELRPEDIEPPPAFGSGIRLEHVTGMGKIGQRFCLLLDIDRVLSAPEAELAARTALGADAKPETRPVPDAA